MNNESRWNQYHTALQAYATREGHTRVPTSHIETLDDGTVVKLGAWVGYIRQRNRNGKLSPARVEALGTLPGWEWGPLRPGPRTDDARNAEIRELRASGLSLQSIADRFGLSRQRVHQITSPTTGGTEA